MPSNVFLWLSERRQLFEFIKSNGLARKLASRFVAGETIESAIEAARILNKDGTRVSLDSLGESVASRDETIEARDEVIQILDAIAATGVDGNVSLKFTQLGLDIDSALCKDNMSQILGHAKELDTFVRIDMEGSDYTGRTLEMFEDLHETFGNVTGVVIQSYLRRSADDIERLIARGARVRLVKGAYAEPPELAFQDMKDVRSSYVDLMKRLLDDGNYPGIATHDERLIEQAIRYVGDNGISTERFEFQMLFGVRRDLQKRLRRQGFNVRIYVPFGCNWYPYMMRRLAERSTNVAFMVASVLKEMVSRK
ncbi:proline dehydrogenase family protein [Gemmatimonadota bacterium]